MRTKFILFQLFVICLVTCLRVEAQAPLLQEPHRVQIAPGTVVPSLRNNLSNANSRSITCDTFILDYSYYNQVFAQENNLTFNGGSNGLYGAQMTSFVDANHVGYYNYIESVFDTLAYVDIYNNYGYFPLASNTITFDSLGFYIGISGSEVNMLNDSLVISIYSIDDGYIPTLVKTIVYENYVQLLPFIQNAGSVGFATIKVGQEFTQGEGFAVNITYLNKDTATHCTFTYSYADSCGVIPYEGQNVSSPAYFSPLGIISYDGFILGDDYINYEDNSFSYDITGVPQSCLYIYTQNFGIYPFIHICPNSNIPTPVVVTTAASNITQTTATLNGTVNAAGDSVVTAFYWGLTTAYQNVATAVPYNLSDSTNTPISASLTGLSPNTTYHYMAVANYPGSYLYGNDMTFTTIGTLSVSISKTAVTCYGDSNGVAIAVASQGTDYTYHWNTGQTTDTISGLASGPYSVTVSANGQTATASVNISQPAAALSITPSITNVECYGGLTGSISLSTSGGTSPYYYQWSGAVSGSPGINSVAAGNYSVVVTDSKQCSVTGSYSISQPNAINISVTSTGSTGTNGTATAAVTGGVAPYTYSWNTAPVQNDSTATSLPPGNYTVTVTDFTNCTASASTIVQSLTGIMEPGNDITGVTLFPNPASEMIQVVVELQNSLPVLLNITDVTGKLVYTTRENASGRLQHEIELSQFSSGVYILEVAAGNQSVHRKFVIAR